MKRFLTLILFVLFTTKSFGQRNYQDVVYLKNGSIIRGVIIEQVPNTSIKVKTEFRNVFMFRMDEIEKLTKEPIQGVRGSLNSNSGLQSGYKGITELGYQIGSGALGLDRMRIDIIINGYQITPNFSFGVGTGLRYYFDAEAAVIPIFVDFRSNFMNDNVSPYLSLSTGYSFDATNGFESVGFLLHPTIGVAIKVSEKSSLNLGLGYELQRMRFYYWNDWGVVEFTDYSNAVSISAGISF